MEKKRAYVKPSLESEAFVPNTYVAACGDSSANYLFTCDAGGGERGDVYLNNGTNLTSGSLHYFHACMEEHSAPTSDVYEDGYLILNGGNDETRHWVWDGLFQGHYENYERISVKIWRGDGDVHATIRLNMNEWTIEKS